MFTKIKSTDSCFPIGITMLSTIENQITSGTCEDAYASMYKMILNSAEDLNPRKKKTYREEEEGLSTEIVSRRQDRKLLDDITTKLVGTGTAVRSCKE